MAAQLPLSVLVEALHSGDAELPAALRPRFSCDAVRMDLAWLTLADVAAALLPLHAARTAHGGVSLGGCTLVVAADLSVRIELQPPPPHCVKHSVEADLVALGETVNSVMVALRAWYVARGDSAPKCADLRFMVTRLSAGPDRGRPTIAGIAALEALELRRYQWASAAAAALKEAQLMQRETQLREQEAKVASFLCLYNMTAAQLNAVPTTVEQHRLFTAYYGIDCSGDAAQGAPVTPPRTPQVEPRASQSPPQLLSPALSSCHPQDAPEHDVSCERTVPRPTLRDDDVVVAVECLSSTVATPPRDSRRCRSSPQGWGNDRARQLAEMTEQCHHRTPPSVKAKRDWIGRRDFHRTVPRGESVLDTSAASVVDPFGGAARPLFTEEDPFDSPGKTRQEGPQFMSTEAAASLLRRLRAEAVLPEDSSYRHSL